MSLCDLGSIIVYEKISFQRFDSYNNKYNYLQNIIG